MTKLTCLACGKTTESELDQDSGGVYVQCLACGAWHEFISGGSGGPGGPATLVPFRIVERPGKSKLPTK